MANSGERRHHGSRPILGRRLPEKDAADARAKVRRPADGECVDVEWSLLKPSGVIGDKHERAETDLAALNQSTAGNHDDDRKYLQLHQQVAKTPAPRWAPTVVVLSLTVEWGGGMERQDPSYGVVVHTRVLRVQALLGGSNSPTSRCPEAVDWIICV